MKSNQSQVDPMVLTEDDLGEIGDKIRDITTEVPQ